MTTLFSLPPALPVAQSSASVTECSVGGADLTAWARDHGHSRRRILAEPSGLRFAFYWRVSTEDHQDPVSSRQWLDRASATISGAGRVVVEYGDVGLSRSVSPLLRPGMAALLSAVRDPGCGFDAVVIGSHERAFFGNQYSHVGLLLAEASVQLWLPEVGGALDPSIAHLDELMTLLGILARREVIRARARPKSAMSAQVRARGRWVGGRVPYGCRPVDAGPHPNKADARWGRRLHRLDANPDTGPIVSWVFESRLAGHSVARITRALNDVGIACPSACRRPRRSTPAAAAHRRSRR